MKLFFDLREPHHLEFVLVPQLQRCAGQALPEGESRNLLQRRILVKAFLQVVIGNLAVEMVNMVQSDVCSEPLKQRGKLVVGTAGEPGVEITPTIVPPP